jgi:hypothetical protein
LCAAIEYGREQELLLQWADYAGLDRRARSREEAEFVGLVGRARPDAPNRERRSQAHTITSGWDRDSRREQLSARESQTRETTL